MENNHETKEQGQVFHQPQPGWYNDRNKFVKKNYGKERDWWTLNKKLGVQKWSLIRGTLEKPRTIITCQALQWNPQKRQVMGGPCESWTRNMEKDMELLQLSWDGLGI